MAKVYVDFAFWNVPQRKGRHDHHCLHQARLRAVQRNVQSARQTGARLHGRRHQSRRRGPRLRHESRLPAGSGCRRGRSSLVRVPTRSHQVTGRLAPTHTKRPPLMLSPQGYMGGCFRYKSFLARRCAAKAAALRAMPSKNVFSSLVVVAHSLMATIASSGLFMTLS